MLDPTGHRLNKINAALAPHNLVMRRQANPTSPGAGRLWAIFLHDIRMTPWGNLKRTFELAVEDKLSPQPGRDYDITAER